MKQSRELDLSNGIWSVALLEGEYKGKSSYLSVPSTSQGELKSKLETFAKTLKTGSCRIAHVYDYTDAQGANEVHSASIRLNRGEQVPFEDACVHTQAAPKMWEHFTGEFNKKYWKQ